MILMYKIAQLAAAACLIGQQFQLQNTSGTYLPVSARLAESNGNASYSWMII